MPMLSSDSQQRSADKAELRRINLRLVPLLVLTVALGLVVASQLYSSYQLNLRIATESADNLAEVISQSVSAVLRRAKGDLRVFADTLHDEDMTQLAPKGRVADLHALLIQHLQSFPEVLHFHVFNADAQLIATSEDYLPRLNVEDRAWFKTLRDNPDQDFILSEVLTVRLKNSKGVVLGVPIRKSGRFLGVVTTVIDLQVLKSYLTQVDVGPHGIITLRRIEDGRLIQRVPENESLINQPLDTSLTRRIKSGEMQGVGDMVFPGDGVMRRYAFRRLPDFPVFTVVGRAETDYMGEWYIQACVTTACAISFLTMILVMFLQLRSSAVQSMRLRMRSQTLLASAAEGIISTDRQGRVIFSNPAARRMLGWSPDDEGIGRDLHGHIHHHLCRDGVCHPHCRLQGVLKPGTMDSRDELQQITGDEMFCRDNDHCFPVEYSAAPILAEDGMKGRVLVFRDISARKDLEHSLRASEDRLRLLVDSVKDYGIYLLDKNGLVVNWNTGAEKISGWSADEVVGKPFAMFFTPEDRDNGAPQYYLAETRRHGRFETEGWRIRKNGRFYWASVEIDPVHDTEKGFMGYAVVVHDISPLHEAQEALRRANADLELRVNERTAELEIANNRLRQQIREREAAEQEVRRLSLTDELTGLHNRRGFFLLTEQQLRLASRSNMTGWLLFADVDGLKTVNDTLGHEAGDRLISEAAEVLRTCFRESDIIGRLGGDEFVVFAINPRQSSSELLARLEEAIEQANTKPDRDYPLSLSLGVAIYGEGTRLPLDTLLAQADAAMYEAKRKRHRNRDN